MGYRQNLYLRYWDKLFYIHQGRDQGLFVAPLYFNRAGYVSSDALNYPGNNGYFWSSTVSSSSYAYYLYFVSTNVNPASNVNRYHGRSVRCLVPRQRPRTICCSFILQPGGLRALGCFVLPRLLRELLV